MLPFLAKLKIQTQYPHGPFSFDPLLFTQAVNEAHTLGRDRLLKVAEKTIQSGGAQDEFYWLLRILFYTPKAASIFPFSNYLMATPPMPQEESRAPYFPLLLIDDVPLMISDGLNGNGIFGYEQTMEFVTFLKRHGQMRAKPLLPTADIFAVADRAVVSPHWLAGRTYTTHSDVYHGTRDDSLRGESDIRRQLLRFVRLVYPKPFATGAVSYGNSYPAIERTQWKRFAAEYQELNVCWDGPSNNFVARYR